VAIQTSDDPTAFKDFEHEGWERASASYMRNFSKITQQTAPAMLDAASVGEGTRVLDVCTGPGILAAAAAERGADAVGLDFSDAFVALASEIVPGAEFRQGDAHALPFDDNSFDAVVCGYGIIHLSDPETALKEMHRVLKPGGRIAVSVWEAAKPTNGFGIMFGAIVAHGKTDVPLPHGPDFFQFSSDSAMISALETAGFKDVASQGVEQTWQIENTSDLVDTILESAVRARGLLLAQTDEALAAIRAAVDEGLQQYASSAGGFAVPAPAIVGSGVK